jgi:hypothetical protein
VTNAVLALLRGTGVTVGDGVAPEATTPPRQQYAVLEPQYVTPVGESPLRPEKEITICFRIRSVGQDPTLATGREGPRQDAEAVADKLIAAVMDRSVKIEGPSWRVTRRRLNPVGQDREGPTVNQIDEVELTVAAR